jgi:hypothetical protein
MSPQINVSILVELIHVATRSSCYGSLELTIRGGGDHQNEVIEIDQSVRL